jgi:rSAM/selenodomain-associated transferase 1
MNRNALIIIAKYPEKESVKTRLKDFMSDKERVDLYVSLLQRTIRELRAVPGVDTFIAFAPPGSRDYFLEFNLGLIPLHKGDLGKRMCEAFEEVFNSGYKKAALVGADIPDLSAETVLKAFDILSDKDLVFGPAKDGGYYLAGMNRMIGEVFKNVPWSSDQTLSRSLQEAKKYGYTCGSTETLNDIDTIEDVKSLGLTIL